MYSEFEYCYCASWHLLLYHDMVFSECRMFVQRLTNNLPWPARSPDLASIKHVLDILGCTIRYNQDVRQCLEIITALSLEWAAVPSNDIRTIIGLMRDRRTAHMRADGGHIYNLTLCDIQKMTPTLFFLQFTKKCIESKCVKVTEYTARLTHYRIV